MKAKSSPKRTISVTRKSGAGHFARRIAISPVIDGAEKRRAYIWGKSLQMAPGVRPGSV